MEWIKVSELAKIKGVTERAIRKSIKSGKYEVRKSCHRYKILVKSLEAELQEEINRLYPVNTTIKFNISISEKFKKRALTKFDIVIKWRQFCINYKGSKKEAIKDFAKVYNSMSLKTSYESLNNIGISTILRWDKILKENGDDWKSLIPKYKPVQNKEGLSQKEKDLFLNCY